MTDAYMADETIRRRYGLQEGDTFEGRFSVVSIESILFFIVAAAHHVLERIYDQFRLEVTEQISNAVVATIPWYHQLALSYQHGDPLILDDKTYRYRYAAIDPSKQIVKYASVNDRAGSVRILVSGEEDGRPKPLSNDVLTAFESYMKRCKIAGVVLSIQSLPADWVRVKARVQIDPIILSSSGVSYRDGSRPVELAIAAYLSGIIYGGTLNKTRLVDAIQDADGVRDVELLEVQVRKHNGDYVVVTANNYTAVSGCFELQDINTTLTYHVV